MCQAHQWQGNAVDVNDAWNLLESNHQHGTLSLEKGGGPCAYAVMPCVWYMIDIRRMTVGAENSKMGLAEEAGWLVPFRRFYYCSSCLLCFMVFVTHLIVHHCPPLMAHEQTGGGDWCMRRQRTVILRHFLTISSNNNLRSEVEEYCPSAVIQRVYAFIDSFILSILPIPNSSFWAASHFLSTIPWVELEGHHVFLLKCHPVAHLHPLPFPTIPRFCLLIFASCSFLSPTSLVTFRLRRK